MKKYYWTITVIVVMLFIIGIFIPRYVAQRENYVGNIGHIFVNNSSDVDIKAEELTNHLWTLLHSGAPSPILATGRLFTQRVEILEFENIGGTCNKYKYRLYTFFNINFMEGTTFTLCGG